MAIRAVGNRAAPDVLCGLQQLRLLGTMPVSMDADLERQLAAYLRIFAADACRSPSVGLRLEYQQAAVLLHAHKGAVFAGRNSLCLRA